MATTRTSDPLPNNVIDDSLRQETLSILRARTQLSTSSSRSASRLSTGKTSPAAFKLLSRSSTPPTYSRPSPTSRLVDDNGYVSTDIEYSATDEAFDEDDDEERDNCSHSFPCRKLCNLGSNSHHILPQTQSPSTPLLAASFPSPYHPHSPLVSSSNNISSSSHCPQLVSRSSQALVRPSSAQSTGNGSPQSATFFPSPQRHRSMSVSMGNRSPVLVNHDDSRTRLCSSVSPSPDHSRLLTQSALDGLRRNSVSSRPSISPVTALADNEIRYV
jgi:hypothetical protein